MTFHLTQLVLMLTASRITAQNCVSDVPSDGSNAVQISFFSNPSGGELGDDCPIDCEAATPIKVSWYAIDQGDNYCYQWPGNSGQNSMNYGTCDTAQSSFTYDQWTNCECSGTPGATKTVYTSKCVVDRPSSLCQMVTNFTACTVTATSTDLYPPNQTNAANWNPKIEVLSDRGTALFEQLFADFDNINIQIVSSPTDIWTESPIYVDSLDSILFSAPGDRNLYRYDLDTEETSILIENAGVFGGVYDGEIPFAECNECGPNGLTIGLQGYEDYVIMNQLALARVIAFDPSNIDENNIIVIADNYNGTILNSPNDITLNAAQDALYFTDPPFGLQRANDTSLVDAFARSALGFQGVYRVDYQDVVDGDTEPLLVVSDMDGPNGLAVTNDDAYLIVSNTADTDGNLEPYWNVYSIENDYALHTNINYSSSSLSFNQTASVPFPLCDGMEVFNDEILLATCPNGICLIDLTNLQLVGRLTLNQLISNLHVYDDQIYVSSAGNVFTITLTGSVVEFPTSTEEAVLSTEAVSSTEGAVSTTEEGDPDSAASLFAYLTLMLTACNCIL